MICQCRCGSDKTASSGATHVPIQNRVCHFEMRLYEKDSFARFKGDSD